MAKLRASAVFAYPKFRYLLAVLAVLWLGLGTLLAIATSRAEVALTDPLVTPIFYLIVFGGSSLWVLWQYRRHDISLPTLIGSWPERLDWPSLIGVWAILFLFSLGAFQTSFGVLSYLAPEFVNNTLAESLFLSADETAIPWLYNVLMGFVLVVAAPILEEFLFRGFLLHRWGNRWNPPIAVLLTSLLFGVLHGNIIGLTGFGLVMALLYFRTSSLGVVIAVHALNNAIAASLELLSRWFGHSEPTSLAEFRSGVWLGVIMLAVSIPFLVKFVRRNWPRRNTPLPYFANGDRPQP